VLAKGGHGEGNRIVDRLIAADESFAILDDPRIDTRHTHGTGCTLSSAIATLLGKGLPLRDAVVEARRFVRKALLAAPGFGGGHGPMGHQAAR
jgi:hydroxymethylpyrimidine/phosphomethylpyrimidine kinase